jgi:hypothetical protein
LTIFFIGGLNGLIKFADITPTTKNIAGPFALATTLKKFSFDQTKRRRILF